MRYLTVTLLAFFLVLNCVGNTNGKIHRVYVGGLLRFFFFFPSKAPVECAKTPARLDENVGRHPHTKYTFALPSDKKRLRCLVASLAG